MGGPLAGHGWSSPIVWGDTVFVTSAVSTKPFKKPTPGLYGNEYIAELSAQGLSDEEILKRTQARDNELSSEASEVRFMVYALDAVDRQIKWEREAVRATPFGGRHRKNTYASETPFTDGERLYASFGQNVGLFCYTLDGKLLWKSQWKPQTDLPGFRHRVFADRVRRPRLSAAGQRRGLIAHRARRQDRQADLADDAAGDRVSASPPG